MPWGDKAVSPCVFVPGVEDAGGMSLSSGLVLADGRLEILEYPLSNLVLSLFPENYDQATGLWIDASGNGFNFSQSNTGLRPIKSGNRITFNGHLLSNTTAKQIFGGRSNITTYVALKRESASDYGVIINFSNSGGGASYGFFPEGGMTSQRCVYRPSASAAASVHSRSVAGLDSRHVQTWTLNTVTGSSSIFLNGSNKNTTTVGAGASVDNGDFEANSIGRYYSASLYNFIGEINAIMVYSETHSDEMVQKISSFLASKYS